MKIRIKFSKDGMMKFIGHLDMMRYFQKAFRRADIDIAYSQGFSPHQLISFAAPLGVGLTSDGEYMDIMVHSSRDSATMLRRLNREMVEGVTIQSWHLIEDETKNSNAMAILAAADYEITFRDRQLPDEAMAAAFEAFMARDRILVEKNTKKAVKTVDIRPMIHKAEIDNRKIFLMLSAGSVDNLKPEKVMETFFVACGRDFDPMSILIRRREMYARTAQGTFISLDDLGKEIPADASPVSEEA